MDFPERIEQAWPDWHVLELLGRGSFSMVYLARRQDLAGVSRSAIKATRIPQDPGEADRLRREGLNEAQIQGYFSRLAAEFAGEIRMMESVKGYTNLVGIEDYKILDLTDATGFLILIRMELLTPMTAHFGQSAPSEADVRKLGLDLCRALHVCREKNIVHRDVKPENIFFNDRGDAKLGDFGVARTLEKLSGGMTRIGTLYYMAPEVYNNALTDEDIASAAKVDEYSLGLVLYELMNAGRLPFFPLEGVPTPQQRSEAMLRRMRGEAFPPPVGATQAFADVIMRACSARPEDRYPSAQAFAEAIEALPPIEAPAADTPTGTIRMDPKETPGPKDAGLDRLAPSAGEAKAAPPAPRGPMPNEPFADGEGTIRIDQLPGGGFAAAPLAPFKTKKRRLFSVRRLMLLALIALIAAAAAMYLRQARMDRPVAFSSGIIEAAVREALGIGSGDITPRELLEVKSLTVENAEPGALDDLKNLGSLVELHLRTCRLETLKPLQALEHLELLDLAGSRPLPDETDASLSDPWVGAAKELSGLGQLKILSMPGCGLQNIEFMRDLKRLEQADLRDNQISDVTPLAGLPALNTLYLSGNDALTDVRPLAGLNLVNYDAPYELAVHSTGAYVVVREGYEAVNVRAEPRGGAALVGTLTAGTMCDYLGQTEADDGGTEWYRCAFKGEAGWVSSKYARVTDAP